jgi:hypothetical protein
MNVLALFLLFCTLPQPEWLRCTFDPPMPSESSRVLTVAEASRITTSMPVKEIYERIGPPYQEVCSGIYCYYWRVEDGRRLLVGFGDPCGTPMYVTWQGSGASS